MRWRGVTPALLRCGGIPVLLPVILILLAPARVAAQRLVAVTPVLVDSTLACRLETAGLPGQRLESSLLSGLAAAIRVDLALHREDGGELARRRVDFRLVPDLWDGTVEVRWEGHRRLLAGMDSLRAWLRRPPPLAVATAERIARQGRGALLRLRAAVTLQSLAPAERSRLAEAVSGGDPARDRRETTIGVDRLIRLFFRGRDAPSPLAAESSPFRLPDVPVATARGERP